MTISKHEISAVVEGVEYEAAPAYDIEHDAVQVYAEGFESGLPDAYWNLSGVTTVARTGGYAAYFQYSTDDSGGSLFINSLTGLTAGLDYTLRVWAGTDSETATVGLGATPFETSPVTVGTSWTELVWQFTAAEATQNVSISHSGASLVAFDDITLTQDAYTEHVPADVRTSYQLDIVEAQLTMDDGWSPYIQCELTCYTPPEAALELIDPRENLRVTVTVAKSFGDWNATGDFEDQNRTFNLLLRGREVDHLDGTMTVTVESDEGLLQDFALVALEDEQVPGLSVKDAVTYALAKVGAELKSGASDADIEATIPAATNFAPTPQPTLDAWNGHAQISSTIIADQWNGYPVYRATRIGTADTAVYPFQDNPMTLDTSTTYRVTYWLRASTTGTAIQPRYYDGSTVEVGSTISLTDSADWTKVSFTFEPSGSSVSLSMLRSGGSVGQWFEISPIIVTAGTGEVDYFDGDSLGASWTGTANDSTSTRLATSDAMIWTPGTTAWGYLEPLFQSVGLRLYCNEAREWILEPSGTLQPGQLNIAAKVNATEASDTISRARDWYDSVVIRYTGNRDADGLRFTSYDVAGAPGTKALVVEYDRASPGPGAAQSILNRAIGKGRVLALTSISDYRGTPGMSLVATLPASPIQTGIISSVQWAFPDGSMTIASRGLTDTPESAWALAPVGVAWEDVPAGTSWTEYDPDDF